MPRTHRRLRRGVGVLQLIVALPVLLITTLAIFQFGFVMVVQQTVTAAATEGARAAAKEMTASAANMAAIAAVNSVLDIHGLVVDPTSTDPASDTKMVLEYAGGSPVITGDPGLGCSTPSSPSVLGGEVRVTVCVDLTTSPLLNVLTTFGFDFTGKRLEISSMAALE